MNPFSIIAMATFIFVSLILIRHWAPYQKTSKLKYISLKSEFLAKCLIPKQSGYVKVNDRKKISVFSFIFYILFAVLLIGLLVMFILPDIPCEPFSASFGRRGQIEWTVNTLNEKLIYLLPMLFFLIEIITFFSMGIFFMLKNKNETKKTLFSMFAMIILFVVLIVFFVFVLF